MCLCLVAVSCQLQQDLGTLARAMYSLVAVYFPAISGISGGLQPEAHEPVLLSNPMKYTIREGYLTNGMDLQVATVTFTEAEAWCSANDRCCGFTFEGQQPSNYVFIIHFRIQSC